MVSCVGEAMVVLFVCGWSVPEAQRMDVSDDGFFCMCERLTTNQKVTKSG